MTVQYAVIVRVPDPEKDEIGNMALPPPLYMLASHYSDATRTDLNHKGKELIPFPAAFPAVFLSLRQRVFVLGEVMALDDNGREIGGRGRMPSKWDVGYETFSDMGEACKRAMEVIHG